jgi:outer membrane protein OmpA-like peptidoglycan-associated protein
MPIKKILLVAACLSLGACASPETGQSYMDGRAHPLADNSSVYAANRGHQDRENCQMYERDTSKMAYIPRCMRKLIPAPPAETAVMSPAPVVAETAAAPDRLLPITRSYPVYFALDKSGIQESEKATLDQITSDMGLYHPPQVTVTGHTDRSGSAEYNQGLSERRANAVSRALNDRGIANQIINEQARGETQSAVETADGVKLQANRRAMIDFRGEERVTSGASTGQ